MQNRYTGDVGDFGKYGLLRALCLPEGDRGPALRLGVVWYLTSDESHNNDGRHIGYLEPTPKNAKTLRVCDPSLGEGATGEMAWGLGVRWRAPAERIFQSPAAGPISCPMTPSSTNAYGICERIRSRLTLATGVARDCRPGRNGSRAPLKPPRTVMWCLLTQTTGLVLPPKPLQSSGPSTCC